MAYLAIEDLSFSYPEKEKGALSHVSLQIEQGQYITLCGASGSGKTTLLRHLKTVLTPHGTRSGEILYRGKPLQEISLREQSEKIGYVMQNPDSQIVTDKVWHELAFGLESLGTDQQIMRLRVAEMASYFGIQDWFYKDVATLSGGQKQLLNLASIMAMQPDILVLDEPTSQLDPIAAADFLNTVRKINLELGTTVILSEHRLEEVFPCADRVIVMENGSVLADDSPKNIGAAIGPEKSELFLSLPAPMQIFYSTKSDLPCPLTVREGRQWLSQSLSGRKVPPSSDFEAPPQPVKNPAIELKEVWFRYEKNLPDVLKGVTLKIEANTIHALMGGNGTGKSTMLKAICGICKPYRGKVLVEGKPLDKYKGSQLFDGCLAMLPQDPVSLFVKKTVEEDLREMFSGKKLDAQQIDTRIEKVAAECEIQSLFSSHPYDLSGGEQQRVALAKVLLCQPKVLLLDEPTKGMDNAFKEKLARVFGRLKERGVTLLLVSHDIEFCARFADQVSMFFDGSIVTTNTPRRFFSQNSFYTTAANRMSRHLFPDAVSNEDVIRQYERTRAQ